MSQPPPPPPPPPPQPPGEPQQLGYAQLYTDGGFAVPPPASIKAIGITGLILGSLTLLNHLVGLAIFLTIGTAQAMGPAYHTFQVANSAVFGTAAAVLLAGSIGCLSRAEWGRRTLLAWAVVYPALLVAGTGVMVGYVIPTLVAPHNTGPQGQTVISGAYGGALFVCLAMLVLPTFILVYLRRPYVRAAFNRG